MEQQQQQDLPTVDPSVFVLKARRGGNLRSVVRFPNDFLTKPVPRPIGLSTLGVNATDPEVLELAEDMAFTMYSLNGVGLAANQVSVALPLIVCDVYALQRQMGASQLLALWNPIILDLIRDKKESVVEGCLSFPGVHELIERSSVAVLRATSISDGEDYAIPISGALARVIQHEVDHLNGMTMLDRMSLLQRQYTIKRMSSKRAPKMVSRRGRR